MKRRRVKDNDDVNKVRITIVEKCLLEKSIQGAFVHIPDDKRLVWYSRAFTVDGRRDDDE